MAYKCENCEREFDSRSELGGHLRWCRGGDTLPGVGRKWSKEEINLLGDMYGEIPATEISKKLDRTTDSIYEKAQSLGLRSNLTSSEPKNKVDWTADKETFSYIFGVCLGDGSVSKNHEIGLTSVDKRFVDSFEDSLNEIGLPTGRTTRHPDDKKKEYSVKAHSVEFHTFFCHMYREGISNFVTIDRDNKVSFLRGLYESEGGISSGSLDCRIWNTSKWLIDLANEILNSLGYETSVDFSPRENRKGMFLIRILGGQSVSKEFLNEISPVIKLPKKELKSKDELKWWKEENVKFLEENYGKITASEIADRLDCETYRIYNKAISLGLESNLEEETQFREGEYRGFGKSWTDEETEFLKSNYGKITAKEIAERLDCKLDRVYNKARRLGLSSDLNEKTQFEEGKSEGKGRKWEDEEVKFLKLNYGRMDTEDIADKLDRSTNSVYCKAGNLNLSSD